MPCVSRWRWWGVSLTLSQLASHAARVLEEGAPRQALAYAWPHPWSGGESIEVGGRTLPLRYCGSNLEVREALAADGDTPTVLLIGLPENALGQDILARFARHRLLHVDRWQLVQDAYGVRQVDPRLFPLQWLPAMLLDAISARSRTPAPVLTLEDAMATCLAFSFGLPVEQPGLEEFARTCEANHARWLSIAQEQRAPFRQHLLGQFGPLADAFLAAVENGNGHAITAIGLACDVLYADQAEKVPELRDARVRLESRLGGHRLQAADGKRWARLAQELVGELPEAGRVSIERMAFELLHAVGADEHLALSSVLSLGLDARLDRLGDAIERFLRAPEALVEVEAATAHALAHRHAPGNHLGLEAARMAARLCRSLVDDIAGTNVHPVGRYLGHGAWQDWARRSLRGVRPERFARAVTKLLDQVALARRAQDEAFASSLLTALRLGEVPAGLTPVESALDRVVAPLASQVPLLLVVLDGMSADVSLALSQSLLSRGWTAWDRRGEPLAMLATVPSVTECSRTSLLSGRLARGVARQEAQAFAAHEGLRRASRSGQPPQLFHKAGVEQSHQLSTEVASAIADTASQVVAVVINAIDDALAKSDQVRIEWDIDTIPLLAEVLDQAARAGRAVILTSDHGHVLERDSTLRPGGAGERYRAAVVPAAEGELLADGPRVRALMDSAIVVPWREDIRYAVKKNGYHGGVSRQEMIVPLGIWTPPRLELPEAGYVPSMPTRPAWWDADGQVAPLQSVAARSPTKRKAVEASGDLFVPRQTSGLADALLASSVFGHQQARMGRVALDPQRLAALVRTLEEGGGRARVEQLARAIEMPVVRMRGVVSILQRSLNIDGFPVVTFEQATGTVLLDPPLLRTQFQL